MSATNVNVTDIGGFAAVQGTEPVNRTIRSKGPTVAVLCFAALLVLGAFLPALTVATPYEQVQLTGVAAGLAGAVAVGALAMLFAALRLGGKAPTAMAVSSLVVGVLATVSSAAAVVTFDAYSEAYTQGYGGLVQAQPGIGVYVCLAGAVGTVGASIVSLIKK